MEERTIETVSETSSKTKQPLVFILDVDGVMTTGQFLYTADGKSMKVFGADDNDGLSLLKNHIEIRFVTGDKKGFPISKKRIVDDMGFELEIVSTIRRIDWIAERYPLESVIYMGDGIFDHYVMSKVGYQIECGLRSRQPQQIQSKCAAWPALSDTATARQTCACDTRCSV